MIDGQSISFDPSTVPDPPPGLSYAHDNLDQLFVDWQQSSHIVVGGGGIAIRHWDLLYQGRVGIKRNVWKRFRSTWHNWKVRGPSVV